jgi:hypothetical protein
MWKISTTLQRSLSAGAVNPESVHGHAMSQLQFSKYVPSSRHGIAASFQAVARIIAQASRG